uniref:Uncharacterized protein n=1 Tax=Anguilla anguilla TaxID=7936 RepID=A0A0E9PEV9_ANGAN
MKWLSIQEVTLHVGGLCEFCKMTFDPSPCGQIISRLPPEILSSTRLWFGDHPFLLHVP